MRVIWIRDDRHPAMYSSFTALQFHGRQFVNLQSRYQRVNQSVWRLQRGPRKLCVSILHFACLVLVAYSNLLVILYSSPLIVVVGLVIDLVLKVVSIPDWLVFLYFCHFVLKTAK